MPWDGPPRMSVEQPATGKRRGLAVALAAALTLLNAVKPLHVDDSAYYAFARHIALHPADPYGFTMMSLDVPVPATQVLAPPVLPYWWALAIALFGMNPVLWKLWLFPFCLSFTLALLALLRRFTAGLEAPLLLLTVLSPVFLPAVNLMLDVPAMALALVAVALFLHATERNSMRLAVMAGLIAGLAMQTKYTSAVELATILAYAFVSRRMGQGAATAVAAITIFVSWEAFMAWRYGQSHFMIHLQSQGRTAAQQVNLAIGLVTMVGGLAPAVGLVGLAALGRPRWLVLGALCMAGLAYAFIGYGLSDLARPLFTLGRLARISGYDALFGAMGLLAFAVWTRAGWTLCRTPARGRMDQFLAVWLLLEVAGCFAISPFPAARRVMGIVVAGTLVAGRLAARACVTPQRRRLVWEVVAAGILLGLIYYCVDLREAASEKEAARAAARLVRRRQPDAAIWHTGYWGFQFYAELDGMREFVPGYELLDSRWPRPVPSRLRRGDWLVLPDPSIPQQGVDLGQVSAQQVDDVDIMDQMPLRTLASLDEGCYYGGRAPLRRLVGPRFRATILRITADVTPRE